MKRTLDLDNAIESDSIAQEISNNYVRWKTLNNDWYAQQKEKRNFLFATDTSATAPTSSPWMNSTTIPKLTQLRDNLLANYSATLFPRPEWYDWEANSEEAVEKRPAILNYVYNKTRASEFMDTALRLLLDWIDYGNCFSKVKYVNEQVVDANGKTIGGYIGPKVIRISPFDIVFDPTALDFSKTPKILRSTIKLGELKKWAINNPQNSIAQNAFKKAVEIRGSVRDLNEGDHVKEDGFQVDGFGSYREYLESNSVEVLTFYGDLYDITSDTLLENHKIKIIDRAFVLDMSPNDDWMGEDHIHHSGWRLRPDNLFAMGPLDNLVGLQYRMDHLENMRADAFDQIAYPLRKIRGDVEPFEGVPGEDIYIGDEGDVTYLNPDTTVLTADTQIDTIERRMEDMAGAPRQAIGLRTPGEKTAFEVQTLDNASNRLFLSKAQQFEKFLTNNLNSILSVGRQNMVASEQVKLLSTDIDVEMFATITPEDLQASGSLRPVGASHFSRKATLVQNITALLNGVGSDPSINSHISGKGIAKLMEEALGLEKFDLVEDNIRLFEQMETQRLAQQGAVQVGAELDVPVEDINAI
jgi:hypothetical protein